MIITEVWVPGNPRTKGSLTAKGGHAKDSVQSSRWRALMAEQVRRDIARRMSHDLDMRGQTLRRPYESAVDVELVAFLSVPAAVTTAVALFEGGSAQSSPAIWHNAGDVDKLARNVLDAIANDAKSAIMNGGAIVNDNQVVRLVAEKYAAAPGEQGLWLRVTAVSHEALLTLRMVAGITVGNFRRAAVR